MLNSIGICLVAAAVVVLPTPSPADRLQPDTAPSSAAQLNGVRRRRVPADPLGTATALDVMAACLRAGLPVAVAATSTARCAPDRLAESLQHAADLLVLGADPADAWQHGADLASRALAQLACRSARSGASLATGIAELAEQLRETAMDTAVARAERAGVLIAGPLGLCFLPAFVCLGIVPVVIGLAHHVLSGGLS